MASLRGKSALAGAITLFAGCALINPLDEYERGGKRPADAGPDVEAGEIVVDPCAHVAPLPRSTADDQGEALPPFVVAIDGRSPIKNVISPSRT